VWATTWRFKSLSPALALGRRESCHDSSTWRPSIHTMGRRKFERERDEWIKRSSDPGSAFSPHFRPRHGASNGLSTDPSLWNRAILLGMLAVVALVGVPLIWVLVLKG
jgi:hypothetical protein